MMGLKDEIFYLSWLITYTLQVSPSDAASMFVIVCLNVLIALVSHFYHSKDLLNKISYFVKAIHNLLLPSKDICLALSLSACFSLILECQP